MDFSQYPAAQKQFQQQRYDDSSFYGSVQQSYPSEGYKTNSQPTKIAMDEHSWGADNNKNKINRGGNSRSSRHTSESDSAAGWYAPSSTVSQNNQNNRRVYNNWQSQPLSSYPPSILTMDTGIPPLMGDIYEGESVTHHNINNRNRYQNHLSNGYNGSQQSGYKSRNGSLSYEEQQNHRGSIKTGVRRFLNNELSSASENDSTILPNNKFNFDLTQSVAIENLISNNINEQKHSVNKQFLIINKNFRVIGSVHQMEAVVDTTENQIK